MEGLSLELREADEGGEKTDFWARLGRGALDLSRRVARAVGDGVRSVDPDLRRFASQLPAMGLTQLASYGMSGAVPPQNGERLVVFVHGLGGSRGNFLPMLFFFRAMGRQRCLPMSFEDSSSVSSMAAQLRAAILEADAEGLGVDLVCHSMGGIVARVALEDAAVAGKVAHLVTLGTPHSGSLLARYAQTEKILDLRPDSELMERLSGQIPWGGVPEMPPLTAFWSREDMVIMPPEAACVEGAENIQMEGFSHLSFLLKARAWQAVMTALEPGRGSASASV
jgi:triacylglycerol esterase/lipase EstA (alpha/beta hydrolase family)